MVSLGFMCTYVPLFFLIIVQSFKSDADDDEEEVVVEVSKKTGAMKMSDKEEVHVEVSSYIFIVIFSFALT